MHHKRDWKQYNRQLINRGHLNFWVKPDVFDNWKAQKTKKNGHPFIYADVLITAISFIRFKYHLSLRETEGFFRSFVAMIETLLNVPSYTQICRRMKMRQLPTELLNKKNITDIVFDTTGLKICGEGEWRATKYGGKKRWKKLHLALDPESGKLMLAEITDEHVHDTALLGEVLKRSNRRKGTLMIDGIADSGKCYDLARKHNKQLLTPPSSRAIIRREQGYEERNDAIRIIKGLGGDKIAKSTWGKLVGYNRRVIIESKISAWKRVLGFIISAPEPLLCQKAAG